MVGVQYAGVAFVPFVVAAIAAVMRKWRLVIAALLVYPLKLIVEKLVLKEIVYRAAPGTSEPDAVLRHVPAHGPSFPSGHAIVAFALAGIVAPYLSRGWRIAAYVGAVAVAFSRIYLGAHNPLDVLGRRRRRARHRRGAEPAPAAAPRECSGDRARTRAHDLLTLRSSDG